MTTTKKRRKKRTLTKAELRTLGVSPGLMACWVGPDGRARLEQLTAEGSRRREVFARSTLKNDANTP